MKIHYLLSLITLISLASCKKSSTPSFSPTPTLIVTNKEEQMPVWVEGKTDANTILLAVHGGPGSDVLDFRNYQNGTGFKEIEKSYLVAYWQQRAAGQSAGPDNKSYYTIAQYVEDCDRVVDSLIKKYPGKKIVMLGHSWGGMLTSSYLSDAGRRAKISAWINAAGATNGPLLNTQTIDDLNAEADRRIAANQNTAYWTALKAKIKAEPASANSIAYSCLDMIPEVTTKVNDSEFKTSSRYNSNISTMYPEITKTDNSVYAPSLTLPTLIIWGTYDYAVPKKQRDEIITKRGTNRLTVVELTASGHYMMFHEPIKFANAVVDFISKI